MEASALDYQRVRLERRCYVAQNAAVLVLHEDGVSKEDIARRLGLGWIRVAEIINRNYTSTGRRINWFESPEDREILKRAWHIRHPNRDAELLDDYIEAYTQIVEDKNPL